MTVKAMYVDYEYCSGCHSCEIACKNEKGFETDQDLWGVKVLEVGPVELEESRWEWNYIPVFTQLCDLCEERVEKGEKPACVLHCLAHVLECDSVENLSKKMEEKGSEAYVFMP